MPPRICLVVVLCTGCATIFTGTRSPVSIESDPPGAHVVVMNGLVAELALQAPQAVALRDRALRIVEPFVPPAVRDVMMKAAPDELLTQLVLWTKVSQAPAEWIDKAGGTLQQLPQPVVEQITELLGVEAVGVTPMRLELGKGRPRAIVTWQNDRQARLLSIGTTFNWVVLVNVLNFGIGAIVDVLTGAWLNLTPSEVRYTLAPPAVEKPASSK